MRSLRILLVEDSPSDVRLVKEALRQTSVPVQLSVARDGVEAMDQLSAGERDGYALPDLIVLDLNLPRMNGREVLAAIKQAPGLKQIPVVIMTSSRADEDVSAAYLLNANCYITKPSDFQQYMDVVRAIEDFWFFTATLPEGFQAGPTACTGSRSEMVA